MSSFRGDEPLVAGRFLTAKEIIHGTAHLAWIGDSISALSAKYFQLMFAPDRWKGFTSHGVTMLGSSTYNGVTMTMGDSGRAAGSSLVMANGQYSFMDTAETIFTGLQLFPAEATAFSNRLYEFNNYLGGPTRTTLFRDQQDILGEVFSVRVVGVGSTAGMINKTRFKLRDDSNNVLLVGSAIDFRTPGNGVRFALDYTGVPALGPSADLQAGLFGIPGQTALTGETSIIEAVRYERAGAGLTWTGLGWGASNIQNWNGDSAPAIASASYAVLASLEVTHVAIMLTNNDPLDIGYDAFLAATIAVMEKIKAVIPAVQFILITQYDTNADALLDSHWQNFSRAYYDLSQSRDDVLYLNVYKAMDNWAQLLQWAIIRSDDHIHPTDPLGMFTSFEVINGLFRTADILSPTAPDVNTTFGTSIVEINWEPDGTPTDLTSAVLQDKDNLWGVVRTDTGETVVAAGTAMDHDVTGHYFLVINNPAADLTYRFAVTIVDDQGRAHYVEKYSNSQGASATVDAVVAALTGSTISITQVVDVTDGDRLNLVRGDDHTEGTALPTWVITDYAGPSMVGGSCVVRLLRADKYTRVDDDDARDLEVTATIEQVSTTITITAAITSTQSALLLSTDVPAKDTHEYQIIGTTSGGKAHSLKLGPVTVLRSIKAAT